MSITKRVDLTAEELLLLDGKVRADVQEIVNAVKMAQSVHQHPIVGATIADSLKTGRFRYEIDRIQYCRLCNSSAGYAKHKRSGRYHNKGGDNHKKPLYMQGIRLNPGFVRIAGHGDFCCKCDAKDRITTSIIETILSKQLPIELVGNKRTQFKRDDVRICRSCNKEMYESEMGREMTMMGDGYYPSKCPHCGTKSNLFASHGTSPKFRMLPVESTVPA